MWRPGWRPFCLGVLLDAAFPIPGLSPVSASGPRGVPYSSLAGTRSGGRSSQFNATELTPSGSSPTRDTVTMHPISPMEQREYSSVCLSKWIPGSAVVEGQLIQQPESASARRLIGGLMVAEKPDLTAAPDWYRCHLRAQPPDAPLEPNKATHK